MKKRFISVFLSAFTLISTFTVNVYAKEKDATPNLTGEYAIIMDADTKEVLYAKSCDTKTFPASITKLMTAIIADENSSKGATYIYPNGPQSLPTTSISRDFGYISEGTKISATDAMKAMLMYSANDYAQVIAANVPTYTGGDTDNFVALMNKKAKEIGMEDTNFVTVNGLDNGIDNHLTTAYDLALLGIESLKHPWVKETISTAFSTFNMPNWVEPPLLQNSNKFIRSDTPYYDSSAIGGKTGNTDKAGRCLLSIFNRNGKTLVAVVLKADYYGVFDDMKALINYGYTIEKSNLVMKDPISDEETEYTKDTKVATVPVTYKVFQWFGKEREIDVPIYIDDTFTYYDNDFNKENSQLEYKLDINIFNDDAKNKVGTLNFIVKGETKSADLYTDINSSYIKEINKDFYTFTYVSMAALILAFLLVIILVLRTRNKAKRRKNKRKSSNKR